MKFAKIVFLIAGIYGIILMAPFFLLESTINATQPPAITHPEYYYGFVCVTCVWQILFLVLAQDPLRYRPFMLLAVLEKVSGVAFILLVILHRSPPSMLIGIVDVFLGTLFLIAYIKTAPARNPQVAVAHS
ncbi:hypothetical protein KDA_55590 [Dictyobacter alpinus]|uniref:DUF4345 domain-containing protein n=1 Tax=Dictyobacter alpinus TaxID=2014873 RepID=A0A402BFA9_9CHLR|nr:hypothetical protein [Dictyobacter alpinus]GCE30075.1 hypothetical protein KDA_55590 [Dictyobacter alpinus]